MLERFGMTDVKAAKTPMDSHVKISLAGCPQTVNADLQRTYRAIVGSLMYLMLWTQPDLSFVVAILTRFMHAPGDKHL